MLDFPDGAPIDLVPVYRHRYPGYGRSPKADAGLTMTDMAEACWEAIDDALPERKSDPGRLFGGLVPRPSHVSPAPRQNRGARAVRHWLQPQQGIH